MLKTPSQGSGLIYEVLLIAIVAKIKTNATITHISKRIGQNARQLNCAAIVVNGAAIAQVIVASFLEWN
jgi:hypothetical protein